MVSVELKRLKDWAEDTLPSDSVLRSVLLADRDNLDAYEFLGRIAVWLRLLPAKGVNR